MENDKYNPKILGDIKDTFTLLDGDKDGFISIKDLCATMCLLNPNIRPQDADDIIIETENDILDFETYNGLWRLKLDETYVDNNYGAIFYYLDKDRNGLIDSKDIYEGLSALGAKISEEEANEMILEADLDGDKMLDKDEFGRMMLGM